MANLNLYLITPDKVTGYGVYRGAVVAARNAIEARRIHPSGNGSCWDNDTGSWPTRADKVEAELLGKALKGTKEGVILADFFGI